MIQIIRLITYKSNDSEALKQQLENSQPDGTTKLVWNKVKMTIETLYSSPASFKIGRETISRMSKKKAPNE